MKKFILLFLIPFLTKSQTFYCDSVNIFTRVDTVWKYHKQGSADTKIILDTKTKCVYFENKDSKISYHISNRNYVLKQFAKGISSLETNYLLYDDNLVPYNIVFDNHNQIRLYGNGVVKVFKIAPFQLVVRD